MVGLHHIGVLGDHIHPLPGSTGRHYGRQYVDS